MFYIAVVLITGSDTGSGRNTAELYLPPSGTSCPLPKLPDDRHGHTVSEDGLLCGGEFTNDSCLQWSPDTGSWDVALTLDVRRQWHTSWTPANSSGTFLMGGYNDWKGTALIKPDGTQESGFSLEYDTV